MVTLKQTALLGSRQSSATSLVLDRLSKLNLGKKLLTPIFQGCVYGNGH